MPWTEVVEALNEIIAADYSALGEAERMRQLIAWARARKDAETLHRPDVNIYKRTLIETWDQVITKLESGRFGQGLLNTWASPSDTSAGENADV